MRPQCNDDSEKEYRDHSEGGLKANLASKETDQHRGQAEPRDRHTGKQDEQRRRVDAHLFCRVGLDTGPKAGGGQARQQEASEQ